MHFLLKSWPFLFLKMNMKFLIFIFSKLKRNGCSPANNKHTYKEIWTEQKHTAPWSYSIQAYICPTSCPCKKSAIKMHEPTDKLNPEECEYPLYLYFEFNRIVKGSKDFSGLISPILKFSSITQIHYSTNTYFQSYIKIFYQLIKI